MSNNIGSNGKIQVRNGEGISQAILREAGISSEDAKKIKGSDWNSIFNEVKTQQAQAKNGTEGVNSLYSGGENLSGPTNRNFVVHKNAVLEFTQQVWTNILNIINTALGRTGDNALKYDATNTNNDTNGTNPPAGGGSAGSAGGSGAGTLTEAQTQLKTQTETLMNNALGDGKTITKAEVQSNGTTAGYIYSYEETPEGGEKQTVEVTTDANGKPTTVILKDKNGVTTVTYNLADKTMMTGHGDNIQINTLNDEQLAKINEQAFLMANDEHLDAAKKAVADIVTDLNGENSHVAQNLELNSAGALRLKLSDRRQVNIELNDKNEITGIYFVNNVNDTDGTMDIDLYNSGKIVVDRDTNAETTEDRQSITQADDATLFNMLKAQLQPLIDTNKDKINELKDEKFTTDNQTILNEGAQVVTAFKNADAENITTRKDSPQRRIDLTLSNGKEIGVELMNDGKTIRNIYIRMGNEDNGAPDDISDIVYRSDGEIYVDPDKDYSSDNDTDHTYVSTQASGYDELKQTVIALLAKKGITGVE